MVQQNIAITFLVNLSEVEVLTQALVVPLGAHLGSMGYILFMLLPNAGRIILAHICLASSIPFQQFFCLFTGSINVYHHLLIMGFLISWNDHTTNKFCSSAFAEIVLETPKEMCVFWTDVSVPYSHHLLPW